MRFLLGMFSDCEANPAGRAKAVADKPADPSLTFSPLLVISAVPVLRDAFWSVLVLTEDSKWAYALENRNLVKSSPAR